LKRQHAIGKQALREWEEGDGVMHGLKRIDWGAEGGNDCIVERSKQL
jgi:hypothetical protein